MDQITRTQIESAQLTAEPIPDGWILSGAPKARAAELSRTPDGSTVVFLWDCTEGEYLWRHRAHETIEILEGEAIVDDGGGPMILRAGAQARFKAGAIVRWRVPAYVQKVSWCRDPQPQALRLARRAARKLRTLLPRRAVATDAAIASHG